MSEANEFDEWAKRFETRRDEQFTRGKLRTTVTPAKCMYPIKEGPHLVAHLVRASTRSADDYPVCRHHKNNRVRAAWRGYVQGA